MRHIARRAFAAFACVVAMAAAPDARVAAQEALQPGEAFVTQFSGTAPDGDRVVIDLDGTVGSIIDMRTPGGPPQGEHWWNEPQRHGVTAGDVGQVFGVALDDATPPNIYVTATSAFGLHRNTDNTDWMTGMWGPEGGPGTVYRLRAANNYAPEVFARITLDGRPNTGAALGNIAFDRWNDQLYISDMETGMIHRLRVSDGFDLGTFDHGLTGRTRFLDVPGGEEMAQAPATFDPATRARIDDCPTGDVARTPSCWNYADFRRRVWGVGVRRNPLTGEVRLFYATWGSQGFGHPDYATAGDDRRNAVWSVGINEDGDFDAESVRREAFLPDFFRSPEAIAAAGASHPVSDIAFPAFGDQEVMLLAERGGARNLGLDAENAFAAPQEARVLRYVLDEAGTWQPIGRYDVGFYDRREEGPPYVRAGASGGVSFGMAYGESWEIDSGYLDAYMWMSGDALCSPRGACFDASAGEHTDTSEVHGVQGRDEAVFEEIEPDAAFQAYPAPGPATPSDGPDNSYMIDTDINVADGGGIEEELTRNDATRVGDVEVYQPAPDPSVRPEEGAWYGPWEESWPWPVPMDDVPPLPGPPPAAGWPELGIEKLPAECLNGAPCLVTIIVTNNGPGVYEGPVHVLETTIDGRLLATVSPGWTCEQPAWLGPIGCRSDWVTLLPGESVTLQILFEGWALMIPDPAPAFVEIPNCAFIVWPRALGADGQVRAIEAALLLLGYDPGLVDGIADAMTYAAIDDYRLVAGLPPGGIDDVLLDALFPGASGMPGDGVPGNDWDCAPIRIILDVGVLPPEPGDEPLPHVEPLNIDLGVTKEVLPSTCEVGGTCDFIVTVTNLGSNDFEGPVVIHDVAALWAVDLLPDGSINATLAELGCDVLPGEGVRCAYADDLSLSADGGFAHFGLRVDVPADAAGQRLRNCAWLDWGSMTFPGGRDIVPGNDHGCANVDFDEDGVPSVPLEEPAEEEEPEPGDGPVPWGPEDIDLHTSVQAPDDGTCTLGGECEYRIEFTNISFSSTFDGPLWVSVTLNWPMPGGGSIDADYIRSGFNWICEDGGTTIQCRFEVGGHDDVMLAPGESEFIDLTVRVPAEAAGEMNLEVCATVFWERMDMAGDADPGNDSACDMTEIRDVEPAMDSEDIDLELVKTGPEQCVPGDPFACRFVLTFTNLGDLTYNGRLNFTDEIPEGSTRSSHIGGWLCNWFSEERFTCSSTPRTILSGESAIFDMDLDVPEVPVGTVLSNCADLIWPIVEDEADRMLRIESVLMSDLGSPGWMWDTVDGEFDEVTERAIREYQSMHDLEVTGTLTDEFLAELFGGSAGLLHDRDASNDHSCHEFEVGHGHDIGVFGDTVCQRGESCPLDVRLENVGTSTFEGSLGVRGQLSPAVPLSSVKSETEGLSCSITGEATYECFGESLSIKPGRDDAVDIQIVADIPADFGPDEVSHIKKVLWPDLEVQDGNSVNDRQTSIITIEGPAAPEAQPAPDLAITKIARQGSCVAGQTCGFAVTIANQGAGTFVGPLRVSDVVAPSNARLTDSGPSPWSCRRRSGRYTCTHPSTTLAPGESRSLSLTFTTRASATGTLENCAELHWNDASTVFAVQSTLNGLGFDSGTPDGKAGPNTRRAVRAFQAGAGMAETGRIDDSLLARLFETWGDGDGNSENDAACAEVALEAPPEEPEEEPVVTPEPSQPAACTGGRYRNNQGQCVCPSSRPEWNGSRCVEAQAEEQQQQQQQQQRCSGGRSRNDQGRCVCPDNRPVWTGIICIPRILPQQQQQQEACTGGRYRNNKGQCVCPRRRPVWNGERCVRRSQTQTPTVTPSPN